MNNLATIRQIQLIWPFFRGSVYVKFKPLELGLVLILSLQILMPLNVLKAAEITPAFTYPVLTKPTMPIPYVEASTEPSGEKVLANSSVLLEDESTFTIQPRVTGTLYVSTTAYNSLPNQTDDTPQITAWGTYTRPGVVASNYFTFGTKLRFPELFGDRIFVVEDRMNARYHRRIDIWMPQFAAAKGFGLKWVKVEVIQ